MFCCNFLSTVYSSLDVFIYLISRSFYTSFHVACASVIKVPTYLLAYVPSVLWCCWLGGRKGIRPVKTERWGAGVVICLSEVQTCIWPSWCQCHSPSLCFSKIQIGFTSLYRLNRVVPDKGPLNGCVCVTYLLIVSARRSPTRCREC